MLDLLQIADSAFPIGTHAHSYGLEELVRSGVIVDAAALHEYLGAHLDIVLAQTDLVALRWAYDLARQTDMAGIERLDAEVSALKPIREWSEASVGAGRRMLATVCSFLADAWLQRLLLASRDGVLGPHHVLAYAAVGQRFDIGVDDLARAYAFGVVTGQVSAAVRLVPLGQTTAQQTIHRLKPEIERAVRRSAMHERTEMGGGLPLAEIAGMRHERAAERLFIS